MPLRIRFTTTCCTWMRSAMTLGQPLGELEAGVDAAVGGTDDGEPCGFANHLVHHDRLALVAPARDEGAEAADHVAGAMGLCDGLLDVGRGPTQVVAGLDKGRAASPKLAIAVSGWFSSWTMVEAISPIADSRPTWLSSAWRVRARASAATRVEMSRMKPVKTRAPSTRTSPTASSIGKVRPLACAAGDGAADADDVALAGGEVAREVAVVLAAVGLGHEQAHVAADDLGRGIAEHPLRRGAEALDGSARADGD